jgi:hypothetical protein
VGDVRKWWVSARIERRASWYLLYFAGGRLDGKIFPAPPLIVKGELEITSSKRYLEIVLPRYIWGVDVSRENVLRGMRQRNFS